MGEKYSQVPNLNTGGLYARYRGGSGKSVSIGIRDLQDNLSSSNIVGFSSRVRDAVQKENLKNGSHTVQLSDVPAKFSAAEADTIGRFRADVSVNITISDEKITIDGGRWSQHAPDPYDFSPEWGDRGPGLEGFAKNSATWLENKFERMQALVEGGTYLTLGLLRKAVGVPDPLSIVDSVHFSQRFSIKIDGDRELDIGRCFGGATLIYMANGSRKPIETIRPGDVVASFDETAAGGRGALVGRRVVRTFVNENQVVIDFHGTKVTPGHAYLCGDGPHEGRFRQIMNIVRDDGAVVLADGSLMRAATGCAVGSPGDSFLEVQIARPARHRETGEPVTLLKERGRIRAGTRVQRPDGSFFSFLDLIEANGWTLHEDGLVGQGCGRAPAPLLWAGPSIPRPEDHILARSQLTLADLYEDPRQAEGPNSPLPFRPEQGETNAAVLEAAAPREGTDDRAEGRAGRSLLQRARNLLDAKRRKPNRVPRQAGETVH